jgi:hypothetical protein
MTMRRIAALAISVALTICGCGNSTPIAHTAFIARAKAICVNEQQRAKQLAAEHPTIDEAWIRPYILEKNAALRSRESNELAALTLPTRLRVGYSRFVSTIRHEVALERRLATARRAENLALNERIAKEWESQIEGPAKAVGLKPCAEY